MQNWNNITDLSHELTYHRYMMNQGQMRGLFQELSIPEYIALHAIARSASEKGDSSEKTYLKDIAGELRLSISQASKMAGGLRDKGLVTWSHDGNGSEGTYVAITSSGLHLMERQETILRDYYTRVAEKFGRENLVSLLELMVRLEAVMDEALPDEHSEGDDPVDL